MPIARKVFTCIDPEMLSLSLRISCRFFVPKMFLNVVCANNLEKKKLKKFKPKEFLNFATLVWLSTSGQRRLDLSGKNGRWQQKWEVAGRNLWELDGSLCTLSTCHLSFPNNFLKVQKSEEMKYRNLAICQSLSVVNIDFARILLSFPLFSGNLLWRV